MSIKESIFFSIGVILIVVISLYGIKFYNNDENKSNILEIQTETKDTINIQDSILYYNTILINYRNELDSIFTIQDNIDSLSIDELDYFDSLYNVYEKNISNTYNKIDSLEKTIK